MGERCGRKPLGGVSLKEDVVDVNSASGSSMVGTKGKRVGHPQWNKAKRSQAGTGEVVVKFVLEPFKLKSSLWGTHKSARSTTRVCLITDRKHSIGYQKWFSASLGKSKGTVGTVDTQWARAR